MTMQSFICSNCTFEYNPLEGDAENAIQPGTLFAQLPETWTCPVCSAAKTSFKPDETSFNFTGLVATSASPQSPTSRSSKDKNSYVYKS